MKYREIVILNLIGVIPISLLFIYQYFTNSGVSSYLLEIEHNTMTTTRLIIYTISLVIYSVAVEFIFKRLILETAIQKYERKGAVIGIVVITFLYLLIHSRYGNIGSLIYSGTLIIGTSIRYTKNRCWKTNAIWHIQWNLVSLVTGLIILKTT